MNGKGPVHVRASAIALCVGIIIAGVAQGRASVSLKTTTTDDKTASVGLPAGWSLAKGLNGYIYAVGPHGERVNLGALVVAKNASEGTPTTGEVAFSLPFSAGIEDKFVAILHAAAANQGTAVPTLSSTSIQKMKLPMCSKITGAMTISGKASRFETIICSLKPDYLGLYKNLIFLWQVPSSEAASAMPVAQQIAGSYRVTPQMFKRMLAPYTPLPPASAMPRGYGMAPYQDPTNADCFDYNVIRESPPWEMPMHCGGWQPG